MALTVTDLKEIASRAKGKGSHIFLNNVGRFTATDLKEIASRGEGTVIFDLTKKKSHFFLKHSASPHLAGSQTRNDCQ